MTMASGVKSPSPQPKIGANVLQSIRKPDFDNRQIGGTSTQPPPGSGNINVQHWTDASNSFQGASVNQTPGTNGTRSTTAPALTDADKGSNIWMQISNGANTALDTMGRTVASILWPGTKYEDLKGKPLDPVKGAELVGFVGSFFIGGGEAIAGIKGGEATVEAVEGANAAKTAETSVTAGMTSEGAWSNANFAGNNLARHFGKHAQEWNEPLTQAQYLEHARTLLSSKGPNILEHVDPDGTVLKYNRDTNEFVVGKAGTIQTLLKPTDGEAYWDREIARGPHG